MEFRNRVLKNWKDIFYTYTRFFNTAFYVAIKNKFETSLRQIIRTFKNDSSDWKNGQTCQSKRP